MTTDKQAAALDLEQFDGTQRQRSISMMLRDEAALLAECKRQRERITEQSETILRRGELLREHAAQFEALRDREERQREQIASLTSQREVSDATCIRLEADRAKASAALTVAVQQVAKLREALTPYISVEERKLASLEKRPYSIGVVTVRERLEKARAALEQS